MSITRSCRIIKKLDLGLDSYDFSCGHLELHQKRSPHSSLCSSLLYVTLIVLWGLSLAAPRIQHYSPCTLVGDFFLREEMGVPHSQPWYNQNGSIEAILNGLSLGSPQGNDRRPKKNQLEISSAAGLTNVGRYTKISTKSRGEEDRMHGNTAIGMYSSEFYLNGVSPPADVYDEKGWVKRDE
ncbi:hypothetical protein SDJN03_17091, partial [Cucurbita argyrosperma subsp. sororia]